MNTAPEVPRIEASGVRVTLRPHERDDLHFALVYQLYLLVDVDNARAIPVYEGAGFRREGVLVDEFFSDGRYRSALRVRQFQHEVLAAVSPLARSRGERVP